MIHELRIYEAAPGHLPALNERFGSLTTKLFAKHGMHNFGYWTEEIGTTGRLVYIVGYDNLADRYPAWEGFRTDPEWVASNKETAERGSPIVNKISNVILRPTDYSPQEPESGEGRVYELRRYDTETGHLPSLNQRFANVTCRLFEKHGIHNIGYWTEEVGVNNRLDYLVAYENLGAREKVWGAFRSDPEWVEASAQSQRNGRPVILNITNTILRPTAYSALR